MNKNLRGLLRETMRLCRQHWRALIVASFLPFLLAAIISTIQLWQMRDINAAVLAFGLNPTPEGEAHMQKLGEDHFLLSIGFLIFNLLITAWHFTRIVQFWKSKTAQAFALTPGELRETAVVVVYGLYVGLVFMLAYFAAMMVIMLASQILSLAALPALVTETVLALAAVAMLVLLLGLIMRLLAGFAGIAQGGTPRLMRDLWPLAAGATFSLTWRSLVITSSFMVLIVLVVVVVMIVPLAGSGSAIIDPATRTLGSDAPRALAMVLTPALVAGQWVRACFMALFSTFLTLVFERLSGQKPKPEA